MGWSLQSHFHLEYSRGLIVEYSNSDYLISADQDIPDWLTGLRFHVWTVETI